MHIAFHDVTGVILYMKKIKFYYRQRSEYKLNIKKDKESIYCKCIAHMFLSFDKIDRLQSLFIFMSVHLL